jgi:hypothetical protein
MTAFAFIMGVVPLVLASGAAQRRKPDGAPRPSGMQIATAFGCSAPGLFAMVEKIGFGKKDAARNAADRKPGLAGGAGEATTDGRAAPAPPCPSPAR